MKCFNVIRIHVFRCIFLLFSMVRWVDNDETALRAQQDIGQKDHRSPQFMGKDRERFPFAMFADQSLIILLCRIIAPQEGYRCLRECPLQMSVADPACHLCRSSCRQMTFHT